MDEREALLASLRDPVPPEVGWWPLAPGWWATLALAALVGLALVLAWRRHARSRASLAWRRAARAELAALRAGVGTASAGEIVAGASVLARRSLLAVRPRAEVASLTGDAWLRALDAASDGRQFTRGAGRLLARAPYERAPSATPDELRGALDAIGVMIDTVGRRKSGTVSQARPEADPGTTPGTPSSTVTASEPAPGSSPNAASRAFRDTAPGERP